MGVSFFAPASDRGVWTSGSALQANSHEHLSMHWQTSSFPATKSSVGRWVPTKAGGAARVLRRIGWHQVEVTAAGEDHPLLDPLAPGFEAFQWHNYEFPVAARRRPSRPQPVLPAGRPPGWARLGTPIPPRGQPRRRAALGSTTAAATR